MDKNYVENRKLECVQLMGYRVFKEIFLEKNPEFVNKIVNECLEVIKKERDSEIADTSSVKSIVTMLVNPKTSFVFMFLGWIGSLLQTADGLEETFIEAGGMLLKRLVQKNFGAKDFGGNR